MKTTPSLWSQLISPENFARAMAKAIQGRKKRPAVAKFLENADENLENIRAAVARGEFRTSAYRMIEITDPKKRTIYILPFVPDRIVHHALMNILAPIWQKSFIRDSYSCIIGRGLHAASRRAMEFVRRNKYVLKCDIRKFYPSIDHDTIFEIAKKSVHDARVLAVLRDIIYSLPGGKNVPIGNLCSQWLGNLYLNEMDDFIKSTLRVRDYLRYSDDFCLFSNDKKKLNCFREKIREFLAQHLQLNFSKAEIFPISKGLDFVGYRHFSDFILLRKRTMKKIKKRIQKIGQMRNIPHNAADRIRGIVAAAHGWMKFACSYNMRKRLKFDSLKKMSGIG